MRIAVLGSGSRGNAVVVESNGSRLLIDAGFSCRQLEQRLAVLGVEPSWLDGVLVTHEHSDHCRGLRVLAKRHRLPIWATAGTFDGIRLDASGPRTVLRSGEPVEIAGFEVECFSLPHDAREPVGFTLEDSDGRRFGLASDLGCKSQLAWARLRDLDALVLETNHDLSMLREGPYPWVLKQRVASRHGHLANLDAGAALRELVGDRLGHVVCYHLSQTNNSPTLAAEAVHEALDREGSSARVVLTCQDEPTDWLEVSVPRASAAAAPRATESAPRPTRAEQLSLMSL